MNYTYEVGRYVVYLLQKEPMYGKFIVGQRAYFSTEEQAIAYVREHRHKYAGWKLKKELYLVDSI